MMKIKTKKLEEADVWSQPGLLADDYFNGATNGGQETAFMGFINYLD